METDVAQRIQKTILLDVVEPRVPLQEARVRHVVGDVFDATFV